MKVHIFSLGPIGTNGYLLTNNDGKGIFFDPGGPAEELEELLKEKGLTLQAILLTHAHFDHIGGVEALRQLTGAPLYIHSDEKDWLVNPILNGSGSPRWSQFVAPISCQPPDVVIKEEGKYTIGDFTFEVFHTPGHSPGSLSYYIEGMIFSGDVLFKQSIGRTDLNGGSYPQLISSIKEKLFTLPDETIVLPGHGEHTTIGNEKKENPFLNE